VSYCYELGGGVIYSSLYQTIDEMGGDPGLAWKLSRIYDWSVDFFRLQKGDSFKVIYEKKMVDGKEIGIVKILAAQFGHGGRVYNSYLYNFDKSNQYYDEEGNSMKRRYLKAPLEYSRISSGFSRRRFHPVQKRYKAHLGVDYAASTGTPIRSVGDGTVVAAGYSRYNGNYVKVSHTHSQATQYLHMSKIAKGVKKGQRVDQGEVIGYVGSTGLATGPHLCFRFWENGQQINPLTVQAPPAEPLAKEELPNYLSYSDSLHNIINLIRLTPPSMPLEDAYAAK
jgi:murein DD-endopeptidase MepM/ murein hydrolase activator NlpD